MRYFENIPIADECDERNDAPDLLYILYKYLIVFNDFKHEMVLLELVGENETSTMDTLEKAVENRNYTLMNSTP